MGVNLYKLTEEWAEIMAQIEVSDGEVSDELFAKMEQMTETAEEKFESLAKMVRSLLADSEALKKESAHLSDRATSAANQATRLKEYIRDTMIMLNMNKVKGATLNITLTKPRQSVEYDEDKIPEIWYKKQDSKLDRAGITNALKNNIDVPGTRLVDGKRSIIIK